MFAGSRSSARHRLLAARSTGALSLVAGITSAAALTGAAFFTVGHASCADPAQYIRHDNHVEILGGCVDGSELPPSDHPSHQHGTPPGDATGNYRR